jgi:hypothetical protein
MFDFLFRRCIRKKDDWPCAIYAASLCKSTKCIYRHGCPLPVYDEYMCIPHAAEYRLKQQRL